MCQNYGMGSLFDFPLFWPIPLPRLFLSATLQNIVEHLNTVSIVDVLRNKIILFHLAGPIIRTNV
jgi:hypothetical protein